MPLTSSPGRAELLSSTLRRFVRRGARAHIAKLLGKTRPEDVAIQFRGLTPSEQLAVFRILLEEYPESAGEVLIKLEPQQLQAIAEELEPTQIAGVLETMAVDDAVSLIESLPEAVKAQVLELVEVESLEEVQDHLSYEDETAGRIMDSEFFALRDKTTVGEAIATLQSGQHTENVFYLYVLSQDDQLVGVTSLRQLLLSQPNVTLGEVMSRSIIRVDTDTDQEEVAKLTSRYDLLAIPVTDEFKHLVGIVTVDDIIDVVSEEATEDFFKLVGTSNDEMVYQDRSFKVAGFRLPWLVLNFVGLAVAGVLIERFQVSLKEGIFLLMFLPVVMGLGGSIGSQTSTIAVRGLATGQVGLGDGRGRRFLWQQLKVGAVIGIACALLAATVAAIQAALSRGSAVQIALGTYAFVVGISLFAAILVASLMGAMVPLLFKRLDIDPAVASGPLVTTINDLTGILIYFGLASLLIDRLIH